jgi:hypothetical protein
LQEAKLRRFAGLTRQANGELDFDRNSERVLPGFYQSLENRWQGEESVFEYGRKADDADSGPAHAVVDRLVIFGIRGADGGQSAVGLGRIQAEAQLVQMSGAALGNAV